MHRTAEAYFRQIYFFGSAFPCMLFSMVASILASAEDFPGKNLLLSCLTALTGILTGISAYWKWQAETERHRHACHEYDALKQRIELAALKLEMGKCSFTAVLDEVENSITEVH